MLPLCKSAENDFGEVTLRRVVRVCADEGAQGDPSLAARLWASVVESLNAASVQKALLLGALLLHRNLVTDIVRIAPSRDFDQNPSFDVVTDCSSHAFYADSDTTLSLRASSTAHLPLGEYDFPVLLALPQARLPIDASIIDLIANVWDIDDIDSCVRRYAFGNETSADSLIAAITQRYMRIQTYCRDHVFGKSGDEAQHSMKDLVLHVVPKWQDDWKSASAKHSLQSVSSVWSLVAPPVSPLVAP